MIMILRLLAALETHGETFTSFGMYGTYSRHVRSTLYSVYCSSVTSETVLRMLDHTLGIPPTWHCRFTLSSVASLSRHVFFLFTRSIDAVVFMGVDLADRGASHFRLDAVQVQGTMLTSTYCYRMDGHLLA